MYSTHHVTATATSCFHTKDTAAGMIILSLYRSEDINLFPGTWQDSLLLLSYRFRTQYADKHRTLQPSVFPWAKSDGWVAHLLVLSAGDIVSK